MFGPSAKNNSDNAALSGSAGTADPAMADRQATGKIPSSPNASLEVVAGRLDFYLDKYRFMQKICAGQLFLTAFLCYALYNVYSNPPKPQYIMAETDGRVIPLTPINRPTVSKNALLTWVSEAVTSIFTYDYVNWRRQFQNNADYFTEDGFKAFLAQMDKSGTLQTVKDKSMLVSVVVSGSPVIVDEGPINGTYMWKVELPVDATYTPFGQSAIRQRLLIKLNLRAISTLVNPRGVAIDSFNTFER